MWSEVCKGRCEGFEIPVEFVSSLSHGIDKGKFTGLGPSIVVRTLGRKGELDRGRKDEY